LSTEVSIEACLLIKPAQLHYKSELSEHQSPIGVVASCMKLPPQIFLACLASLAENKFMLPGYSGRDIVVISCTEAASPETFCIFCVFGVFSGKSLRILAKGSV